MVIAKLEGTETPEQAEKLRNTMLYMRRDDLDLEDGIYFIDDLIGLTVKNADTGFVYGIIDDVIQTGANDVYIVKENGKEYLIPAIPEVIIETDIEKNIMTIRPLEGLFDEQ